MSMTSRMALAAALLSSVVVTGCAYNSSSPDVYTASQAQREETVRMATVGSVRGGGRGSIVTGIIGGIAGAVAGNAVENGVATQNGLEITVRLDNGDMRAITQTATGEVFQAGERVRLLSSGGVTRVTH